MTMRGLGQDLQVESLSIDDRGIQVTFIEEQDMGGPIVRVQTLIVPHGQADDEATEVVEAVKGLIDKAQTLSRNPPAQVRGRRP